MLQPGQDLPLPPEPPDNGVEIHTALDDLDRNFLVILIIVPHGPINRPHAPRADHRHHAVRADVLADDQLADFRREVLSLTADGGLDRTLYIPVHCQQTFYVSAEVRIGGASSIQEMRSITG